MLDLNITLLIQLGNFFIALFMLNILLIRPIREIIKKRKAMMEDMSGEAASFEEQAAARLQNYKAVLDQARREASGNREESRTAGVKEQQLLVSEAQEKARSILAEARTALEAQAAAALSSLRTQTETLAGTLADRLVKG